MHVKVTKGVPETYSIRQLIRDNPQTSFPKSIPNAILAAYNVFPLTPTDQPNYDIVTQNLTEGRAVFVEGEWVQVWDVVEAPAEEVQQRTDDQAQYVRKERNRLLKDTDWVVITAYEQNQSTPEVWAVYRQQLRDIPEQEGFPFNVTWPTQP